MSDWFKSSYCSDGQCVEVKFEKSSYCAETTCVEVAKLPDVVLVRDNKNIEGGHLTIPTKDWKAFLKTL